MSLGPTKTSLSAMCGIDVEKKVVTSNVNGEQLIKAMGFTFKQLLRSLSSCVCVFFFYLITGQLTLSEKDRVFVILMAVDRLTISRER